ncbi:MAG: response regulator transcription factor [Opitutaceae bacterium]
MDNNSPRRSKIILVDDHPITCQGVAALIDQQIDMCVCGQASTAPQGLALVAKLEPDVAVVDVSLKGANGIEFVKSALAMRPKLLVLMMSMYDETLYAPRAFRAGARGYIMKHEASDEILTALRRIVDGKTCIGARLKDKLAESVLASRSDEIEDSVRKLSDREMEVFQLIGDGYATRQIAASLNLSVKTIDSYREHLKIKLDLPDAQNLLQYAIRWTKTKHLA